jgi:hypothetical protein
MWCVKCHTAFCWNTGIIETQIHNPHYYEWMRSQKREIPAVTQNIDINDFPDPPRLCIRFGNTTALRIQTLITDKYTTMRYYLAFNTNATFTQYISVQQIAQFINIYYSLCQLVFHFMHNEILANEFEEETAILRENYLRRKIEEESYKNKVSAIYKDKDFKECFNKIIQEMFVGKVKDIFENYLYDLSQEMEPDCLQEVIIKYNHLLKVAIQETEREMEKLSTVYGYSQKRFLINDKSEIHIEPISFSKKESLNFVVDKL